ncbi:SO2930 family diheme c-type cytochrome [Sphingomonas corticis]|uniref:SO2930 family diheme c-type cytochrome n=1 Tax=Sphingomonas corticis TaxID=2722791 RepID=UPI001ADD9B18
MTAIALAVLLRTQEPRAASAGARNPGLLRAQEHGRATVFALLLLALLLAACARAPAAVTFHDSGYPEHLSDWGLYAREGERLVGRQGVVAFAPVTPLFSDYALKWRTMWTPAGMPARWTPTDAFDFPVGTIVAKTFYYPRSGDAVAIGKAPPLSATLDTRGMRLIETRLLVRRAEGWVAIPYVWNEDGSDATLARTGAEVPLTLAPAGMRFTYTVPNQNQCAGCHAQDNRTRALSPIGLKARHLDHNGQIAMLERAGYLAGVPASRPAANVDWSDERKPLAARARAYLDINCSHCHAERGPARTSGLWLDAATEDPRVLGLCKPPVAAGRGTGDRPFDVVPGHPDRSILAYRLESTDPGAMMPELGRALAHREGVALVARYIADLKGACEPLVPRT